MSNQKRTQAREPGPAGLRERKKQKTRLAISDVATRMFIERGFEQVTIAEVARAAEVSVNTVFNYFATKEELFFDRGPELQFALSRVVQERKRGESALMALRRGFRKFVNGESGLIFSRRLEPFFATIDASPALRAHARLLLEQSEQHLAETLAAENGAPPGDATARSLAAMIIGVQALLMREFRARVGAGDSEEAIRSALSRLGERGFALLLAAAADYAQRESAADSHCDRKLAGS